MHMGQDGAKIGEAFTLLAAAQAAADPQSPPGLRIQKIADLMKPLRALQQQLSRKHETKLDYRVLETNQTGGKPLRDKAFDGQVLKDYWTDVRGASRVSFTSGALRTSPTRRSGQTFGRCPENCLPLAVRAAGRVAGRWGGAVAAHFLITSFPKASRTSRAHRSRLYQWQRRRFVRWSYRARAGGRR